MLEVKGLDAVYGQSHVLTGHRVRDGASPSPSSVATGWGRAPSARAIMGIRPRVRGSIFPRVMSLLGRLGYRSPGPGVRLRPAGPAAVSSQSPVDEHLAWSSRNGGLWTSSRVYSFTPASPSAARSAAAPSCPAASSKCSRSAGPCSRIQAPDHGRAVRGSPTIDERMIETLKTLAGEGVGLLLMEQTLGVATAVAERQLVMVAGRIFTETTATPAIQADRELQQRFLGVTRSSIRSRGFRPWRPSCSSGRWTRRAASTATHRSSPGTGVDDVLVDAGILSEPESEPQSRQEVAAATGLAGAALAAEATELPVEAMARGAAEVVKHHTPRAGSTESPASAGPAVGARHAGDARALRSGVPKLLGAEAAAWATPGPASARPTSR